MSWTVKAIQSTTTSYLAPRSASGGAPPCTSWAMTRAPGGSGYLRVFPRLRRWTSCPRSVSWRVIVELMFPVPPMNRIFTAETIP